MRLTVYVPKLAALPTIQPGAGIIGSQAIDHPGKLLLDYEDTHPDVQHSRYADRILHAAERHLTGDPTGSGSRLLAEPDDLLVVGSFDPPPARSRSATARRWRPGSPKRTTEPSRIWTPRRTRR
jgi:hypothetical protein